MDDPPASASSSASVVMGRGEANSDIDGEDGYKSENDRSISFIIDDDEDEEEEEGGGELDSMEEGGEEPALSPGLPRPDESAFASRQPSRWNQVRPQPSSSRELGNKRKTPMPPSSPAPPSPLHPHKVLPRFASFTPASASASASVASFPAPHPFPSSSFSSTTTSTTSTIMHGVEHSHGGSYSVHTSHHRPRNIAAFSSPPETSSSFSRYCATPDPGSSTYETQFVEEARIGCGSFGEVFRVRARHDQQPYAIKKSRPFTGKADRKSKLKEVNALIKVKHPHCVKFVVAWEERGSLYIQTELCELGSLKDFMEKQGPLSEDQIWSFLADMLLGVKHIHEQNMVHLDIKPSNMLLVCLECRRQFIGDDHTDHSHAQGPDSVLVKVGDFGQAVGKGEWQGEDGDGCYMAPELLQWNEATKIGSAADIFSLGATIFELAANVQMPNRGPLREKLRKGKIPRLSRSEDLEKVIHMMMRPDPIDRPTADDLLATVPRIRELLVRRLESNWYAPIIERQSSSRMLQEALQLVTSENGNGVHDGFGKTVNPLTAHEEAKDSDEAPKADKMSAEYEAVPPEQGAALDDDDFLCGGDPDVPVTNGELFLSPLPPKNTLSQVRAKIPRHDSFEEFRKESLPRRTASSPLAHSATMPSPFSCPPVPAMPLAHLALERPPQPLFPHPTPIKPGSRRSKSGRTPRRRPPFQLEDNENHAVPQQSGDVQRRLGDHLDEARTSTS